MEILIPWHFFSEYVPSKNENLQSGPKNYRKKGVKYFP